MRIAPMYSFGKMENHPPYVLSCELTQVAAAEAEIPPRGEIVVARRSLGFRLASLRTASPKIIRSKSSAATNQIPQIAPSLRRTPGADSGIADDRSGRRPSLVRAVRNRSDDPVTSNARRTKAQAIPGAIPGHASSWHSSIRQRSFSRAKCLIA
jgi:hypothetical protein